MLLKIINFAVLIAISSATKKCTQIDQPEPQCGPNEKFSDCGPVDDCEMTCKPYGSGQVCPAICLSKCICKEGYVRDNSKDRNCVPIETCSSTCEENETYNECGSGCGDATCQTPKDEIVVCPTYCNVGCFCDKGYVRGPNKKCIPADECENPGGCGDNQEYFGCGSGCGNRTCENKDNDAIACPAVCVEGCFCKEGFSLGPESECIPNAQCPPSCGPNEVWNECARPDECIATCDDQDPFDDCPDVCEEKCVCVDGYVWNNSNDKNCVPVSSCSEVSCGANEVWNECGKPDQCEATCDDQNPSDPCPEICVKKCQCAEGYIWNNSKDKNCVAKSSCS